MTQMLNHCGATEVNRQELALVPTPDPTETWKPIPHATVLDTVEGTLAQAGYTINNSWLSTNKEGALFFGVLDLNTELGSVARMSVGIRNAHDKSFSMGFCAGNRVFVCDNLAFSSEIVIAKRHTKFGDDRYAEGITHAVSSLSSFQVVETQRIEFLQQQELSEDEANSRMLQAYEKGVVSARLLPKLIEEYRNPSHADFEPRTAWSLINAYTEVIKPRLEKYPHRAAHETMKFQALLA